MITMLSFLLTQCSNKTKDLTNTSNDVYTVVNVKNESDSATVTLSDARGGKYQTVISIANGNWIDLEKGDRVKVSYEELLEMDPALMIGSKFTKLDKNATKLMSHLKAESTHIALGTAVNIDFKVTNNGTTAVTFLPWQTPLEGRLTAGCLKVIYNGEELPYRGIMVKRRPPTDEDYITLQPGESTSEKVDISDSYDFSRAGKYSIQFIERYESEVPNSNTIEIMIK